MKQTLIVTLFSNACFLLFITLTFNSHGQSYNANNRFEQLGAQLPTPNTTRSASGAPGKDYWQQRADYDIKVELDEANNQIIGSETITYFNSSPDVLRYIWIQLDQNLFAKDSPGPIARTGGVQPQMSLNALAMIGNGYYQGGEYGYRIKAIKDKMGKALPYTINQTMMRIDLPVPIASGQSFGFSIDWNYKIIEFAKGGRRTGFEAFKDGNNIYEIAQFYPRLCVYDDVTGWQHKQYYSQGEFALSFGNFKLAITVPADHVLGATGELQNASQVLAATQLKRLDEARQSPDKIVVIETQAEREAAEKTKKEGKKTWIFKADNVRDVAFATSRKYIWDAMQIDQAGRKVLCMSFYPKEASSLWSKYSTQVIAHTVKTYSKFSIDYPYPVAISCHGPVGGMEYPMLSFNGGRPEADGTYSEATKYGMIGVIIHEVGHTFFPMIVNNDERQWMWMDEGLNTFLEYLTEKEWDRDFPVRRGEPQYIADYMKQDQKNLVPIMTMSDNLTDAGNSAYAKPAAGLNILRETIMGRELFDYAFKEYARRWAFKSPTPADFFRTMEDASGVDLDWFWKGWFYGVEPVNQSLTDVKWFAIDGQNPEVNKATQRKANNDKRETMARKRDKYFIKETVVERNPDMKDFYNSYDPLAVSEADKKKYADYLASLSIDERNLVQSGMNFYTLNVKNKGGLPMPVIVKMQFEDGTDSVARFPAEIWRLNDKDISKVITTKKKVVQWTLDPFREIADIDEEDNGYPRQPAEPTKFQLFKNQGSQLRPNPMREAQQTQPQPAGQQGGAKN